MKTFIIAQDKIDLLALIDKEILQYGTSCDLNHIDISKVSNLSELFCHLDFTGDISKWDTSHVTDMGTMFRSSSFNGDISHWDVSNVENMSWMFSNSKFNNDISCWNVSKVMTMYNIFEDSIFEHDLSNWSPFCLERHFDLYTNNMTPIVPPTAPMPYWELYDDYTQRNKAIESYQMTLKLGNDLNIKNNGRKIKI